MGEYFFFLTSTPRMMVGSRTPFLETGGCERLNLLNEKLMCICPHCALTAKLDMTLERRDPLHSPQSASPSPSLPLFSAGAWAARSTFPWSHPALPPPFSRSECRVFSSGNHRITACSGTYVSILEARRLQGEVTVENGRLFYSAPKPKVLLCGVFFFARVSSSGG